MKYAIVEDGGKQYRAIEGSTIEVDYLKDVAIGEEMDLPNVLMVVDDEDIMVGTPYLTGAVVQAHVTDVVKGKKVVVFKYRPKKRYRVKTGHRQKYTRLHIDSIQVE